MQGGVVLNKTCSPLHLFSQSASCGPQPLVSTLRGSHFRGRVGGKCDVVELIFLSDRERLDHELVWRLSVCRDDDQGLLNTHCGAQQSALKLLGVESTLTGWGGLIALGRAVFLQLLALHKELTRGGDLNEDVLTLGGTGLGLRFGQVDVELGVFAETGGEHEKDQNHQKHINEGDQVDLWLWCFMGLKLHA